MWKKAPLRKLSTRAWAFNFLRLRGSVKTYGVLYGDFFLLNYYSICINQKFKIEFEFRLFKARLTETGIF
jgi:hypothetical protein